MAFTVPLWGCAAPWQSPVTASLHAPPGEAAELPGEIRDGWVSTPGSGHRVAVREVVAGLAEPIVGASDRRRFTTR